MINFKPINSFIPFPAERIPIPDQYSNAITATGVFERHNDQDWFKIELDANGRYVVDLEGAETGKGTIVDPEHQGHLGASGNPLGQGFDDDGRQGWNCRAVLNVQTAGTYSISAKSRFSAAVDEPHAISLSQITDDFSRVISGTRPMTRMRQGKKQKIGDAWAARRFCFG